VNKCGLLNSKHSKMTSTEI